MFEQRVSFRYARAIIETAVQEGVADTLYLDFSFIHKVLNDNRELRTIIASPVLQHWKKKGLIKEIFQEKISVLSLDFLLFLLDKKRGELILSIISQFEIQYNILNNKLPVEIFSAIGLTDEIKNKIIKEMSEITHKTILPEYKVQPELIGGLMVKVDDWVFDATFKNQLAILFKKLSDDAS